MDIVRGASGQLRREGWVRGWGGGGGGSDSLYLHISGLHFNETYQSEPTMKCTSPNTSFHFIPSSSQYERGTYYVSIGCIIIIIVCSVIILHLMWFTVECAKKEKKH